MIREETSARGLSLGAFHWATTVPSGDAPARVRVPPSILIPSRHGEPMRLDSWFPPHPRGTGETWPPESRVASGEGGGRFPLALAWTARRLSPEVEWHWSSPAGEQMTCHPIDAIAEGVAQLATWNCPNNPFAVVVPNDFRQAEQQKVLDACRRHDLDASLIWLPIAAALRWLELQGGELPGWKFENKPTPKLLVVHVDWGYVSSTLLELVPWPGEQSIRWVPARDRPDKTDTKPSCGWSSIMTAAGEFHGELGKAWHEAFAQPVEQERARRGMSSRSDDASWLDALQGWQVPQETPGKVYRSIVSRIEKEKSRLAGVVVVGDCVDTIDFENIQEDVGLPTSVVQLGGSESEAFLAAGAELFRKAHLRNEIAYLDSLPELELFLEQKGEYFWHPLLQGTTDKYVPGGKPWQLEQPIDVSIKRGEEDVRLVVWHEEYEGVREVVASLNRPAEQRRPGKLYVTATPAQGNAVLRIDLEGDAEHRDSITANWQRMKLKTNANGKPMTREEFVEAQPRAYPELMPRRGSWGKWRNVCAAIRTRSGEFITAERIEKEGAYWISRIKDMVKEKDPGEFGVDRTAVGSDHLVSIGEKDLEALTNACLGYWRKHRKPRGKDRRLEDVVRTLGYISATNDEFEDWLIESLHFSLIDKSALVHACGHCLRDPINLNEFFKSVFQIIPSVVGVSANSLKAVSQALRYRLNATEKLSDEHAYWMLAKCLEVFREDMLNRRGRSYQFRWSCLIVAFLLRRRIYSSEFLPPDGDMAIRAKELFAQAIDRHNSGRLEPIGGSVDTPAAMQQLIDYIDKRGVGVIALGWDG